jgi:hypothetical protein
MRLKAKTVRHANESLTGMMIPSKAPGRRNVFTRIHRGEKPAMVAM